MTITSSSRLLINENPLQVLPSLAVALKNVNEAIMLQQVQYWLSRSTKAFEGRKWVYNTIDDWKMQFPWMTEKTIRNRFSSLIEKKVIITSNFNRAGFDRTKWYTIDYDKLNSLVNDQDNIENSAEKLDMTHSEKSSESNRKKVPDRSGKKFQIEVEESSECNRKKVPNAFGKSYQMEPEKVTGPIPETTRDYSEITQENIRSSAKADEPVSQSKKLIPTQIIEQEFEQLWTIYPRKVAKKKALSHYKAWRKESKDHTYAVMRNKLETYLKYIKINDLPMRFIQIGSTWFNGRFDDELDLTPQKSSNQRYKQIKPVRKAMDWEAYAAEHDAVESEPKMSDEEMNAIFKEFSSNADTNTLNDAEHGNSMSANVEDSKLSEDMQQLYHEWGID